MSGENMGKRPFPLGVLRPDLHSTNIMRADDDDTLGSMIVETRHRLRWEYQRERGVLTESMAQIPYPYPADQHRLGSCRLTSRRMNR